MSPAERDGSSPGMGGLERAAAILGAFDATHRELSLAALVARSGLPRSTAHRTADKMLRLGWLDKPEDRYPQARLARLSLTEEELDRFAGQLDVIISSVARVGEVAADGIPPTSQAVPVTNVFREDVIVPPIGAAAALDQAPAAEAGQFRVPRILAED